MHIPLINIAVFDKKVKSFLSLHDKSVGIGSAEILTVFSALNSQIIHQSDKRMVYNKNIQIPAGRPPRGKEEPKLNIAYFLLPKNRVAFLYDDYTFRQGLEKMRHHGYTAIPVITREGRYVGTVSEGDSLWKLLAAEKGPLQERTMRDLEALPVRDIVRTDTYPSVGITISMEELLTSAMQQNFIPVVDDVGSFIGIVTRKDIIRYFAEKEAPKAMKKIV